MKRCALYLPVSTVDQHPETQLHDLRALAAQRDFQIVKEFTDRISGAKAKRPGLEQLLADARRGQFDVVMVWAFDRWRARSSTSSKCWTNSTTSASSSYRSVRISTPADRSAAP